MDFLPLARMTERVERARLESDTAYFYDLVAYGEMVTKLVTAAMVATLPIEREGHRYRLEYGLVRADGLGDWVEALDDVLTGPASQYLPEAARVEQTALSCSRVRILDEGVTPLPVPSPRGFAKRGNGR